MYRWTLLGQHQQHVATVTFHSSVGVALVVRSLRMLTIADGDVDSLRGSRGNVVIDIGVIASVVLVMRLKSMMVMMTMTMTLLLLLLLHWSVLLLLLLLLLLSRMLVSMSG